MKTIDFSAFQLSKEEMKNITGGADFKCQCKGVGTFTVYNLKSADRLEDLVNEHCEGGGSCKSL